MILGVRFTAGLAFDPSGRMEDMVQKERHQTQFRRLVRVIQVADLLTKSKFKGCHLEKELLRPPLVGPDPNPKGPVRSG